MYSAGRNAPRIGVGHLSDRAYGREQSPGSCNDA